MLITPAGIWLACLVILYAGQRMFARAAVTIPAPVVVSASQAFEGDNGPWSSFALRVGTSAQNVRVFPGTSSTQTIVVLPQGCQSGQPTNCADARGGIFNFSASSTWQNIGIFNLGFESNLGYTDNGQYGFDTVGLGYQGSGGPTINHSVVAGVAGTEFFTGILGLNPRPTNFTDLNSPRTSFLSLLKEQNLIPSLSYSYTAGAQYRPRTVLGSLVLGGYDQSRSSNVSSISVPFFSDQSRDLTVGIQSISSNVTSSQKVLLSSGIYAFIDSSVAELWLPLSVCQAFESAFGLTYSTTTNLYLVNDTLHNSLLSSNPYVTMSLGSSASGGSTISVALPYASFDLQAKYPLVPSGNNSRYFPLRRAANETQYTLGRTFLQEAHLIVDYERGNFTLRPCDWTSNPEYIVAIPSTNSTSSTGSNSSTPTGDGGSSHTTAAATSWPLSSGTLAGIGIGATVTIAAVLGGLYYYFFYRSRCQQHKTSELADTGIRPSSKGRAEVGDDSKSWVPELQGKFAGSEVEGSSPAPWLAELRDSKSPAGAELPTSPAAAEVEDMQIFEMPGNDVPELRAERIGGSKDEKGTFSFEETSGM